MQIQIESPQIPLTTAMQGFIKERLWDEFAFCGERIRKVNAHLSDINGKRGGTDKRCRLVVRLDHAREIVVESTETDMYQAITRATDRMRRAVARNIAKKARFRHLQGLPTVAENEPAASPAL